MSRTREPSGIHPMSHWLRIQNCHSPKLVATPRLRRPVCPLAKGKRYAFISFNNICKKCSWLEFEFGMAITSCYAYMPQRLQFVSSIIGYMLQNFELNYVQIHRIGRYHLQTFGLHKILECILIFQMGRACLQ